MQFLRKFDIYATGNLGLPVVFLLFRKKEVVRMRRFLIGLCILVGGVYACQRVDNESVCGVLYTQEVDTSLVKKYVYENRFIDIDIYAVARMIWAGEQVDTDVMAQVKVALYRYFSHVRIERDKYCLLYTSPSPRDA